MRRGIAILALGLLVAVPAVADDWGFSLRFGGFFPNADSNLFQDDQTLYRVEKEDFRGATGGIEFNVQLVHNLEVGLSIDGYGREIDTSYRDYVRGDDSEIYQTLQISTAPVGLTLRLIPTSRHIPVAPYLAGGVDAIFWQYEEFGDFIDFWDPERPVISDHFIADGVALGFHAAAGLRVYVSDDIAITGEGRYQWAEEEEMGDDFGRGPENNYIDLSGWSATAGIHIRF
jgi:opacity protein-like surface antigen